MIEDGISSLAIRKKISKDDAQNNDADATLALDVYGTNYAYFEHVTLLKTVKWDKDATIVNETINIPRVSM